MAGPLVVHREIFSMNLDKARAYLRAAGEIEAWS